MKVERIAECPPWSIVQYFWPALSDNWYWKQMFGLYESDRFTQVLLYVVLHQMYCNMCTIKEVVLCGKPIKYVLNWPYISLLIVLSEFTYVYIIYIQCHL